jgi:putative acetyltransferase
MSREQWSIRTAKPDDFEAAYGVHAAAFPENTEARLVELLHQRGKADISLVAVLDGAVVGHVLFSPISISRNGVEIAPGLGLAPVAVRPQYQRQGIGKSLIHRGLEVCRQRQCPLVVVLGDPRYYQQFGFRRASDLGFQNEYQADESFMVLELQKDGLPDVGGLVRYASEFSELRV